MSEEEKNSQKHSEFIEASKLYFDLFKHTTTISTGSILILVTFLEKLFKDPVQKWLVGISLISFIISVMCSLINMFLLSAHIRGNFTNDSSETNTLAGSVMLSVLTFTLGIISFVVFVLINFYK